MIMRALPLLFAGVVSLFAQQAPEATAPEPKPEVKTADAKSLDAKAPDAKTFQVETNTRIPLSMINSVSTKNAAAGDRVYLETVFPILVDGRIVIPPGSYVAGTITKVQRPGKVKGRGEFYIRFDSLTLPNGVTRDFRARVSGLDGRASEELDRNEGSIKSEGNKAGDTRTVGEAAIGGASIGALAGSAAGATGMGAGIGAAAGAAAGLAMVLFTRGPDAVLAKGTTVEMVLDRNVDFNETELDFSNSPMRRNVGEGGGPLPSQKSQSATYPRRWPH
jgi:type IV secretion system protein VirB10